MWGWHNDMGWGSGWWAIGPVMMVLFWGGLFWLLAFAVRGRERQFGTESAVDAAEIAARRFAAGEIDEAEYRRIRESLDR